MPKVALLVLSLTAVILTGVLTIIINPHSTNSTSKTEIDTAINQAKLLYLQRKQTGQDFTKGPCLTNALLPGWVLDVVHNPREEIDDLPENQCPSFTEGSAVHFVELDPEGNFIRAR